MYELGVCGSTPSDCTHVFVEAAGTCSSGLSITAPSIGVVADRATAALAADASSVWNFGSSANRNVLKDEHVPLDRDHATACRPR